MHFGLGKKMLVFGVLFCFLISVTTSADGSALQDKLKEVQQKQNETKQNVDSKKKGS